VDNNHIWLVNSEGKNLVKLTNMAGLQHEPVWSHDGEWIYFLSGKGKQAHDIWRVSLKTKRTEQITAGQLYHFDLALSPEGSMAFSNNRTGNYEIWLRDSQGHEKQLTRDPGIDSRPSWSADGEVIIFESSRNGVMNIWRKPIDGGVAEKLTRELIGARYPVWWQD
jgi:TolB protein